jgi:anaerobic magnesium-protoporphyrin IX monomethyl ester cyclase
MKITLIQPKAGRYAPCYIHEPLNLGYLASYIKEGGFQEVCIIVSAFAGDDEEIIGLCRESDIIGFTATSPMMSHALLLAGQIKRENSNRIVVFGGAHPTIEPEETLRSPDVDFVIRGEGERTFLELLKSLNEGGTHGTIRGLSLRDKNGSIIHNPPGALIGNLDSLPFPDRDLFDQPRFLEIGFNKYGDRGAWVLSSRGCPYECTYCASNRIWTRRWRARSPGNIISEIRALMDYYDVDRINFADDTFTVSKKRVADFCQRMIAEKVEISWACNARVDTVDAELCKLMKRAGCVEVWMGVESGSPEILKEIKKDIVPEQITEAFKSAKEAGLLTRGYFMIGSRSESYETIKETERLIDRIKPNMLAFSVLTPYPGCEEFEIWKKNGGKDPIDWSGIDLLETEAIMMETQFLSKDDLKSEHKRLKEKYASLWRL